MAALVATGSFLVLGLLWAWFQWSVALGHEGTAGLDYTLYRDRTLSWLAGTGFYLPRQLTGVPYPVSHGDAYYPPVLLYLMVPFALGLPAVLWWAIPAGVIAVALWRVRPAWWAWPILASVLVYPRTQMLVLFGNPSLWAFALVAAGATWRWPAAFIPFKLTFAPFALIAIRHRSWWIGAAAALALCLPFGLMWADWWTATTNVRLGNGYGLEYVFGEWPIAIAILVAIASGRRRPGPG
jgi:hypothetical protein